MASVLHLRTPVCFVPARYSSDCIWHGSFGPLGNDVRALGLDAVVRNVVCGVGGTEVTPHTLRWALDETRADAAELEPLFVPEGV